MSETYQPSLFNAYTIAFEGSSVACVLYGTYLALAGTNLTLLRKKRYNILFTYSSVQLTLTTLYLVFSLYAAPAQSLAIVGIVGSYGPDALSPWPMIIVNTAFILNTWASDGFLLYRCYIVCMANMGIVALPALLYVATLGSSLAYLILGSTPGAVYSTHAVQVAGICYWSCSAATNVCASALISARFWMHRRAIMRAIESKQGTFYLGYMAMTLESALLYTVFNIVALVMFVLNSPLENVFFPVLGMVQAIAPALIVYRIGRGIALETEYDTSVTGTMRFSVSTGRAGPFAKSGNTDFFDESTTMHASPGESFKTDVDGCSSFIQPVKHTSQV